ncbi:MAG: alpha-ketoglutarate-dependent taurine dioxygenase [Phenylobacterium sp.]|jgi:alpha-ketoglutarate-dependent taurine dioxygenase
MQSLEHITVADLDKVDDLPLILNVDAQGIRAVEFIKSNKAALQRLINDNGALLIRGLKVHSSKEFGNLLTELFEQPLLKYTYRSTPRTEFRGNVYTATEYPEDQVIPQHNENAYSSSWPNRIGFLCMVPPEQGGETPISCSHTLYNELPQEIKTAFEQKQVMYVRNYVDVDLPWREVFQTEDPSDVERYCQDNGIQYQWLDNGLRTTQINPATAVHQQTGQSLWFNQAHLFHISNLEAELSATLIDTLGLDNVPRNTFFGDGSAIPESYLTTIREIYQRTKITFSWQKSDLLLLDNMRFTHGREAFSGERKVLVGMSCPNEG